MVHPPIPNGFFTVVCTPAPLDVTGGDVLASLRPVIRRTRGAVLVSSADLGRPGSVLVVGRTPDGRTVGPARWFGPLRTTSEVEVLADWLDIGGPLAPLPAEVVALLAIPSHLAV